jgi:hypothetical protein
MTSLRIAALAFAALSAAMASGTVSAMSADGLAPAAKQVAGDVQDVRWMCGPYRAVGGHPAPIGVARTGAPAPIGITGVGITTGGEFLAEGSAAPTGDPGRWSP